MLLKKYSYLLLAGCLTTFAISCDDEDDTIPEVIDSTKPTATITSPTQTQLDEGFMPGGTITVTGTVMDDRDLESVTLQLTESGQTTPWHNMTWEEDDFTGNELEINETITIPADAAEGTHVLTLTAQDDAENVFTQSWNIEVMAAQEGNVTLNVTVPESTPEDAVLYVVGTMNDWPGDSDPEEYMLTRNDDGTYTGTFNFTEDAEFKFRVQAEEGADRWKYVEQGAFDEAANDCPDIENRLYTYSEDMQTIDIVVENWRNLGSCPD